MILFSLARAYDTAHVQMAASAERKFPNLPHYSRNVSAICLLARVSSVYIRVDKQDVLFGGSVFSGCLLPEYFLHKIGPLYFTADYKLTNKFTFYQ